MYKDRSRSTHSDCSLVSSLHVVKVAQMYIFRPLKISKSTCAMVQIRSLKSTHLGCSIVNTCIKNQVLKGTKSGCRSMKCTPSDRYNVQSQAAQWYKSGRSKAHCTVRPLKVKKSGRSKIKSSSFYSIC